MKTSYHLSAFGVTFGRDGAGIDDANVRWFGADTIRKPGAAKTLANQFGFVLVDFATKCCNAELRTHEEGLFVTIR